MREAGLVARARTQLLRGELGQAESGFRRALEVEPGSLEARHGLALLAEWSGRLDEAAERCDAILAESPNHLLARLTRGSVHAARGERMSALECFRRAARRSESAALRRLVVSVGGGGFEAPLRAEVTELFEGYADRFDGHLVDKLGYRGHELVAEAVAKSVPSGQPVSLVLELGCGTGLCGPALRPLCQRLVGIDLSPRIAEHARRSGIYDAVYVADLLYVLLVAPSASVDVLVATDVFGYVGDLTPVFAEAMRVLCPGGRMAFSVEAADTGSPALRSSRRFAYPERYLRDASAAHGLEVSHLAAEVLRREAGQPVVGHVVVVERLS